MKKKILLTLALSTLLLMGVACANKSTNTTSKTTDVAKIEETKVEKSESSSENADFDKLVEKAKGTELTFYMWGGDDRLNNWINDYYAKRLKDKYDIKLRMVPMNIEDILTQLSGEAGAGKKDGDIDMIWINGENFKTAKENNLLYGSFTDNLPNFDKYIDIDEREVNYDFGFPIKGFEAPYGKAQLVMYNDSAITPETPKNTAELLEFAKKYKGKVTYPALPDFTGSAFVRNIIYDIVGYEQFADMPEDKEKVKEAIEPALKYLRELNPYLWNEGKTFPDKEPTMKNMYADGELVMGMSYAAFGVAANIEDGTFTDTTRSFQFDKGTIGNTNYIAIANNSGNKEAAMVAINEMISPEVQAKRYADLKTIPIVDYNKLDDSQKAAFDSVEIGKGVLPQSELLSKRLPEMPAGLVPIIEEIWTEEVVGK